VQGGRRPGAAALPVLLLTGVLLVALNLRGPLVAIAPVVDELSRDLHVGAGTVGLLTSIPVLCFGLAAPAASLLIARTGVHRAVLVSMLGVLAGTVVRSLGSPAAAIAGTVVIGLAITVGNIVMPVVIGRDFPGATNVVTAAYTAALNIGSALTSALTAPLAELIGWRAALASWGLLVGVAAVVWTVALGRQAARAAATVQCRPAAAGAGPPPVAAAGRLGADPRLRRAGVQLLRGNGVAADPARRRERHVQVCGRRELLAVPGARRGRRLRRAGAGRLVEAAVFGAAGRRWCRVAATWSRRPDRWSSAQSTTPPAVGPCRCWSSWERWG
jgi:MFS family permease